MFPGSCSLAVPTWPSSAGSGGTSSGDAEHHPPGSSLPQAPGAAEKLQGAQEQRFSFQSMNINEVKCFYARG